MVFYDDLIVGEYTVDVIVEDQVIVELKVGGTLSNVQTPQCRNDRRPTGKPPRLLINFGRSQVEIRRITAQARSRKQSPSSPLIPLHPPQKRQATTTRRHCNRNGLFTESVNS